MLTYVSFKKKGGSRISAAQPDIEFSDNDMIEIMNSWRNTPTLWMKGDNLEKLNNLWGPQRHDYVKSRFGAMKFHLLGNEALVDYIVRYNLRGAVQPEALQAFCERWRLYTLTEQYQKAKNASEKQEPGHLRRSKKIWTLTQNIERGKWIADWTAEGRTKWY